MRGAQERLLAGRFLLLRQLGRGGMGTVWLAADETLGRQVAIKELRPPGGPADTGTHRLRALREARSAAGIKHPHAVTLHEILSIPGDDAVYLIMEYVEGPTLGELIERDGPLPAPAVARYGLQLLDVLAVAHGLGIVHRDVKPANILIAAGDQAKLADFGIAYNIGDQRLTTAGVMGTRAYLAPELLDEKPITPAADLWSLGATLYHAAEGQGAFDREGRVPMLRAILVDDIPVPRCEPHLAAAIAGLLRRDPGDRATIEQTRESLWQVPGQRPAPGPEPAPGPAPQPDTGPAARPPANPQWDPGAVTDVSKQPNLTTPPASPEQAKGRPSLPRPDRRFAAVAAAVLVLAAAGTAGGLLIAHARTGQSNAIHGTSSTPATASGAPSGGTGSSTTRRTSAPTSGATTRASATNGSSSATSSGNAPPPSGSTTNGALSLSKTIQGPVGVAQTGIAYSPNGSLLATYGAQDGSDAILWNPATGASTDLPFGAGALDVAFSADDQTVAVAERAGGVGLWSVATQKQTANVSDDHFATGIAFNPHDNNLLAVGDSDGVRLLTLSTSSWGGPLAGSAGATGPWLVMFSPNGNTLAAVDRHTGYVYVWDTSTGALEGAISPPVAGDLPGQGTSIGYTPGNGLLAISHSMATSASPGIQFWAVQKRAVVSHMQYPGVGDVNALAYDPAATDDYAVVGTKGNVILWQLPAGDNLGDVHNPGSVPFVDVAFNPDAKTIATLDAHDRIALWNVTGVS